MHRLVVVAQRTVGASSIQENAGRPGIERERAIVIIDRRLVVRLPVIGHAAIVEGIGVARVDRNGLAVVLDRVVVVLLVCVGDAAIVVVAGELGTVGAPGGDEARTRRDHVVGRFRLLVVAGLRQRGNNTRKEQGDDCRNDPPI